MVNDFAAFRRTDDGLWQRTDVPETKVPWDVLDQPDATIVQLQEGEAGWALREEWGYVLGPQAPKVHVCGSKEEAMAAAAKEEGTTYESTNGISFSAEPQLRHRYLTGWLQPDDQ